RRGDGRHRGGDGLRRDLEILTSAQVALLCERRTGGPSGARGGGDGAPGENVVIRNGREERLGGKATFPVDAGDVISIRSPGGGGWGSPGAAGDDADDP
ncbi:MAG: hydantoinase B/oxoprolinase family protein, partial [Longimicrobiales bacterium]|nr:hydantoinase B/oxoprolinase family protein [Longimicrobiales bacterium]